MLAINTKYDIGDTVYIIKREKISIVCPICDGKKKIEYKEKLMTCPECHGAGCQQSQKEISVVKDESYKVNSIKISISNKNGDYTTRYKVYSMTESCSRAEENLYCSKEEAQLVCDNLNKERKYINLNDIIISDSFSKTVPAAEKLSTLIDEYKINKTISKEISINNENVLIDGYTAYLVSKMFGIQIVKAIIE